MDDRTRDQEQNLIDAEMRISRSLLRLRAAQGALNRSDDRVRDTKHRRISQTEDDPSVLSFPTVR